MSFDWKNLVGSVAPSIATALGGPLAGMAVSKLAESLGVEPDEKSVVQALQAAKPEDLLAIKKADNEFTLAMEEAGVDLARVAAGDRASARNREIATGDNAPKILAGVIVIGFFIVLAGVATITLPAAAVQPINILLGALTALVVQVGNYYFGSSAGSKRKTEKMSMR